tara:strand:- start:963 stop:1232 length:270 start_codon:yes stop_codon:yes gene_type:complete
MVTQKDDSTSEERELAQTIVEQLSLQYRRLPKTSLITLATGLVLLGVDQETGNNAAQYIGIGLIAVNVLFYGCSEIGKHFAKYNHPTSS